MMKYLLILCLACTSCRSSFYVVRHAEKQAVSNITSSDVPLSAEGEERATALKEVLINKKIVSIYSTDYKRTKSTAEPLSKAIGVPIDIYNPGDTAFISSLKKSRKGNILIVGHSNTIDDIVNVLTETMALTDLPESQYGDLFVIKRKGSGYTITKKRFGN